MTVVQFLLLMNFGRIILMLLSIFWLTWTPCSRSRIRSVMLLVCMLILCSNLINATLAISVLHVRPW